MAPEQKTVRDQIYYCDHCGISFLWSQEEQRQDHVKPRLCPGCRYSLPAPERTRGLVKWYNRRKRYGFITRDEGDALFVHGSALQDARHLEPGDLVEFAVGQDDKGAHAEAVSVLQRAPGEGEA
ncbi:MAG: cold shock domain-containing protein [Caldilineaceae bacterium]|nr:cold shock domain-containing protein [Caldilineaceae bacterium]